MTRIFVYGTLRRGAPRDELLAGARCLGPARTVPRFELVDLRAFPALIPGGRTAVTGEVYVVDGPTLERLDAYEMHPRLYRRTPVALDDGTEAEAYILVEASVRGLAGRPRIATGDWLDRGTPGHDG